MPVYNLFYEFKKMSVITRISIEYFYGKISKISNFRFFDMLKKEKVIELNFCLFCLILGDCSITRI